ncbi:MAG: twin-arginine translocase subunit TatC [Dethiobacteria bacterium]|nr:twin-arginine translocase subunit TatC [Bacillota bacterium]MDW7729972.1 twin-arginine translocase subunit TatC [Bacillota bacterium]
MDRNKLIRIFEDLRKRLIIITVIVFIFAVVSFAFSDQVRSILLIPADMAYAGLTEQGLDLQLIFLTPSEALLANIRLAFITSATITLPIILYQLVALVMAAAGMTKGRAFLLTFIMYVLFALGLSFAYFVVLPFALNFFISFSASDLVPNFSFARYISFVTSFIFSFGLVFQMPVVFWFLGSLGIISTSFLRSNRKFALLIIIIVSALITPPDIFSQVLMAIPLMLLYELGIFMVYLARRKMDKVSAEDIQTG